MPVTPRLRFHLVDTSFTPAGHIIEVAEIRGSQGAGCDRPRHYPVRAVVLLVQGGGSYRDTLGNESVIGPGDLLLLKPSVGHSYRPKTSAGWREYYVAFEGPVFDALESCGVLSPAIPVWNLGDPAPWRERLTALFPEPGGASRAATGEQVGGLIAFLLAAHGARTTPAPPATGLPAWVAQAQDLLAAPGEMAGVQSVARDCGLGYENFRKQFASLVGESPATYRRRALVARAQRLMLDRDLPDRAIAAALGFCDEFHFSKTFKHVAGLSPRAWRNHQRTEKMHG